MYNLSKISCIIDWVYGAVLLIITFFKKNKTQYFHPICIITVNDNAYSYKFNKQVMKLPKDSFHTSKQKVKVWNSYNHKVKSEGAFVTKNKVITK